MRMLDLFCGGGLAGAGYWQSGSFSEIVGVDIDPDCKYAYPFDFIAGHALKLDYDFLLQFDFIHASPPCQFYSAITPNWARSRHPRLIPGTHLMLQAAGKPYVIENVPGSGHDLRPNLILSGLNVGLRIDRPRLFHISSSPGSHISGAGMSKINSPAAVNMSRSAITNLRIVIDDNMTAGQLVNVHGDEYVTRGELIEVFGLSSLPVSHLRRLTKTHIEQGIPPAMTRYIAARLFPKLMIG